MRQFSSSKFGYCHPPRSNNDARQLLQLLEISHVKQVNSIEEVYKLANKPQTTTVLKSLKLAKSDLTKCLKYVKSELIIKQAMTVEDVLIEVEAFVDSKNFEFFTPMEISVLYEALLVARTRVNNYIREEVSWLQLATVFAKFSQVNGKTLNKKCTKMESGLSELKL